MSRNECSHVLNEMEVEVKILRTMHHEYVGVEAHALRSAPAYHMTSPSTSFLVPRSAPHAIHDMTNASRHPIMSHIGAVLLRSSFFEPPPPPPTRPPPAPSPSPFLLRNVRGGACALSVYPRGCRPERSNCVFFLLRGPSLRRPRPKKQRRKTTDAAAAAARAVSQSSSQLAPPRTRRREDSR